MQAIRKMTLHCTVEAIILMSTLCILTDMKEEARDAIVFYFGSCDVLWPHTACLVGLFAWK